MKIWYPCAPEANRDRERLWSDAITDKHTPVPLRLFLKCFSTPSATIAQAEHALRNDFPLVIYNHGMISFAEENTSLMEELASHGCAVVSIQHVEQLLELQELAKRQTNEKKRSDAELTKRLRRAGETERAGLAPEYYARAVNTNLITVGRSLDTAFVLDQIMDVLAAIPGFQNNQVKHGTIHLLGYSVGGAVATEVCANDKRISSVVNLDGGMYGTEARNLPNLPYLMMYSATNKGMNDLMLPAGATQLVEPGTTHLNYHDLAALIPGLRYTPVLGDTNPRDFIEKRNALVRSFILGVS